MLARLVNKVIGIIRNTCVRRSRYRILLRVWPTKTLIFYEHKEQEKSVSLHENI